MVHWRHSSESSDDRLYDPKEPKMAETNSMKDQIRYARSKELQMTQ